MIIEQQQDTPTYNEAEDILEGWCNIPEFIYGYIRVPNAFSKTRTPFYVVGIFECAEGQPSKGQKEVRCLRGGKAAAALQPESGVSAIAAERLRQTTVEKFTPKHDASHSDESMAWVAAIYAAPGTILTHREGTTHFPANHEYHSFAEPWPESWHRSWDKRGKHDRFKQLAIAGALCASEYDRLKTREMLTDPDSSFLDLPIPKIGDKLMIKYSASCFGQCEMECAADVIIRIAYQRQSWRVSFIEQDFVEASERTRSPGSTSLEVEGFRELIRNEWLVKGSRQDLDEYYLCGTFVKRLKERHPEDFKEQKR